MKDTTGSSASSYGNVRNEVHVSNSNERLDPLHGGVLWPRQPEPVATGGFSELQRMVDSIHTGLVQKLAEAQRLMASADERLSESARRSAELDGREEAAAKREAIVLERERQVSRREEVSWPSHRPLSPPPRTCCLRRAPCGRPISPSPRRQIGTPTVAQKSARRRGSCPRHGAAPVPWGIPLRQAPLITDPRAPAPTRLPDGKGGSCQGGGAAQARRRV